MFTLVDHGLTIGAKIRLETTGALPTGLAVKTDYYVVYNGFGKDVFQVSALNNGTPIATSAAGSGTHSFINMTPDRIIPRKEYNKYKSYAENTNRSTK